MRLAIAQVTSVASPENNLKMCTQMVEKAAARGTDLIVFPESAAVVFDGDYPKEEEKKEYKRLGAFVEGMKQLAVKHEMFITYGIHWKPSSKEDDRWDMAAITLNPEGEQVYKYNKIHPCILNLQSFQVDESSTVKPGPPDSNNLQVKEITTKGGETWRLGHAICYDVRYPRYWQALRDRDVQLVVIPTAWFVQSKDHWETLVKARAIDNQFYIAAAAQIGVHNEERPPSFGKSMLAGPWGSLSVDLPSWDEVEGSEEGQSGKKSNGSVNGYHQKDVDYFEEFGKGVCVGYAEISLEDVKKMREELPVRQHEHDSYGL